MGEFWRFSKLSVVVHKWLYVSNCMPVTFLKSVLLVNWRQMTGWKLSKYEISICGWQRFASGTWPRESGGAAPKFVLAPLRKSNKHILGIMTYSNVSSCRLQKIVLPPQKKIPWTQNIVDGTLSAPLGDRHQLLCSTYKDEIWRQSFLCGRASRVEQFASGSSSCRQSTLF